MKTLTVTDARQKLGYWLKRAERGEEIGIICGASLFPLRKVPIVAGDYAEQEYGMTAVEVDRAAARIIAETRALSSADVTGLSLDEFLAPAHSRQKRGSKDHRRAA